MAFAGAHDLIVINRHEERGRQLVNALREDTAATVEFVPWSNTYVVPPGIDILVNATSIGLYPDVDALPNISLDQARSDLFVCDVIPNPPDTRLMQLARARGLRLLNGLSMLVYQGAICFELWTGQSAPEAVMKAALHKSFNVS